MFKINQVKPFKLGGSLLGIIENENEDLSDFTYRPSKVFIQTSKEKISCEDGSLDVTPKFSTYDYGFCEG